MDNKNGENKDEPFIYVYFIESHEVSMGVSKLYLTEEYSESKTLERVEKIEEKKFELIFSVNIYRFKIYPNKIIEKNKNPEEFEVEVFIEDDNKNKYSTKIKNIDIKQNNFLYNFQFNFDDVNSIENELPIMDLKMSNAEQFQIYKNYLKNTKGNKSKEKEDLINNTLNILYTENENNKKYDFSFIISIFKESIGTKYIPKIIRLFKPGYLKGLTELDEGGFVPILNILKIIEKKNFVSFEKEENEEELFYNFYTLYLYLNLKLHKDKIDEIFLNEKIKKYLYKTLLENEDFFTGLTLKKEQLLDFINSSNLNFQKVISQLKYNNDVLSLLQIINEKKDFFLNKYKEYNKDSQDKICIDVDLLTLPKKEDDINNIYKQIEEIVLFEKESNTFFVGISPKLLEKYIDLFNNTFLDKLFSLAKLISFLKKEQKEFVLKMNIDEIIHKNGINLSKQEKLKNIEILNFIENDTYYKDKIYSNNLNYRSLEVLSGINASSIDDEFINKWKQLKMFKIFENQKKAFITQVCNLIKEMNYFGTLFVLLNQSDNNNKKEFDQNAISTMQTKFETLISTYSPEKCPHFIDDVTDLIYYSDLKKVNLESFTNEYVQVMLNNETVSNIYQLLPKKYKDISKNLNKIIINFFTKNPLNNNPQILVSVIKNSSELRKSLLSNMNNYIITENDIFQRTDTENFKVLEELKKSGIFDENNNDLEKTEYISSSNIKISNTIQKIKDLNVSYLLANYNFDDKFEEVFYNRLLVLSSNEEEAIKCKELMKKYICVIKEALDILESILNDFNFFYKNKYKKEIIEIYELINKIKNDDISKFLKEYKKQFEVFKDKYQKDVEERKILLQSSFFRTIYKRTRLLIEDDDKCLSESMETLKKLSTIFDQSILASLKNFFNLGDKESNEKLIGSCLKSFQKENVEQDLNKEIDILAKILQIDYEYDKSKIIENLLILYRKEEILNIANAIKIFIEKTEVKKTEFYEMVDNIVTNIYRQRDIYIIKQSMDDLERYGIVNFKDKENKDNCYVQILIKLKEQPDSIKSLLETKIEDCRHLQELNLENDSDFLTPNDILDFEKCIEFMNKLGTSQHIKKYSDKELIVKFKELVCKNNEIELYFNKFINNYGEIIELMNRGFDNSEVSRKKIDFILESSEFILTNKIDKFFKCHYLEKKTRNNKTDLITKAISLEDLLELRDRAQLSKVVSGDEKEKKIIEKSQKFIRVVSEINIIYGIVQEIYYKGYPKDIRIEIKINKNENGNSIIKFENEEFNDYNKLIPKLKGLLDELRQSQVNAYLNKPLIRYIYGHHFNVISNAIKDKNKIKEAMPFLEYFTNNLITKNVEELEYKNDKNFLDELIINCENYLSKVLEINNLTLETIYKESLIAKTTNYVEYKGVYIYLCEKLEKEIFQIYKHLTQNIPMAQNILLCNENISNEEITSFLYRAILCDFNACFIVGGIESLNSEQKATFLELLNNLYVENHEKMKSCLIFLYTNKSTDIFKSLESVKYRKILPLGRKEFEKQKYEGNSVEVVFSDKSGVGKTHKIKYDIFDDDNKYVHFPLGGVLIKNEIIERLKKLKIDQYTEIHLDICDTNQIQLMQEFLFSLLITKFYCYKESIFYFPKKVKIKIEIPNSFIDFFAKFPILTLFSSSKLSIEKLSPLIISRDIKSNEQVVANYLKALKENRIDHEDLNFPMITPELNTSKMKKFNKKYKYALIDAQIISEKECNELIIEEIRASNNIKYPTYYQLKTFIDILGVQLKQFTQNSFLTALNIFNLGDKDLFSIRSNIVKNFINITKYFTQGAFDDLLKNQIITHKMLFGQYDEGNDIKNAIDSLAEKKSGVFSFEKIDSSLVFFHQGDNDGFSILTNKDSKDKEYQKLLKLLNYYRKEKKKPKLSSLPNYNLFSQKEFLMEFKEILDLKNPVEKSEKNEKNKNLKSLEEIAENYVFTSDNFTKMIFILMRIKSNVPVIMMGETGCGKTALIRKLSELMNNGETDKMKILNIHAGTSDQEIIDFIQQKVIPASILLTQSELEHKIDNLNQNKIYFEKKIWVFLDEINTCNSMGLISELMCKKSCQGNQIPHNIMFIGACNPYRKSEITNEEIAGLDVNLAFREKNNLNDQEREKIKKNSLNSKGKLVYTVNPLPHSLLVYVFDFGNLSPKDEVKYINNMIQGPIDNINNNNIPIKPFILDNIKKLAKDLISESQNFIRKNNDISAVSLREIRRFNIFLEFFYNSLSFKKKNSEKLRESLELEKEINIYESLTEIDLLIYSINLSIFICYYLRITNKTLRDNLLKILNGILSSNEISKKYNDFLYMPSLEEQFIIKNINLDKGISKNRALLENIFSLFVTINNKVPIFIVGKPGCSKSLSVQLINRAMKGNSSTNLLFKSLPKLIINSYQGSMGSTSKGVENIFKKARNILENLSKEDKEKNISMIFFDEMGLAEYSPNNPLKVIHSELEYDLNEGDNKVAFVGISNWRLDASKMNRGIFISIPEPDEEDTKTTAFNIGQSYDEILAEKYKDFFENLGIIYYKYKQYLKTKHNLDGKEDFHGNRDFYHLVKNCAQKMITKFNNNEDIFLEDLIQFGFKSIERNFSGLIFGDIKKSSVNYIKDIFNGIYKEIKMEQKYDVIECVKENINHLDSRYLLLESKSSVSTYLLSSILSDLNKDYCFYIGSKFIKDIQNEEYILKVLNKVQIYMEQGKILIMENLETVYPAMYDLFNQNFTVVSNKNYARLAIGSTTNTYSLVNKNFRCVINVNINEMDKQEAPFLNRFEKQIITFDYLLSDELIELSKTINSTLKDLVKKDKKFKGINYDLEKLLINCDLEEIRAMVYEYNKKGISKEKIIDEIFSKISLILPQDIILYSKFNGFSQKHSKEYEIIIDNYNKGEHINLSRFIKAMKQDKNIVYSFSNDLDQIQNIDNIDNPTFGNINKENTKIINIGGINSENELETEINQFMTNEFKLCIIHFSPDEGEFMNYIKYFLENKEKEFVDRNENNKCKKAYIFIMHMKRIFNNELKDFSSKSEKEKNEINKKILKETISNLSGYYQIFIDNLNGDEQFTLDNLIHLKGNEAFNKFICFDEELNKNIFKSIFYMNYNIISYIGGLNKISYINRLIHYIEKNESLRKILNKYIMGKITYEEDLINKIFKNESTITENDTDILCIIKNYLSHSYTKGLNLIYFKIEKDHLLSSLLSFIEIENIYNDKHASNNNLSLTSLICPEINEKSQKVEEVNKKIKNMVEKAEEIYFENLSFEDGSMRITEKPNANNIEIILGLNLPGSKPVLDRIIQKVKDEICNKYYQNEIDLRGCFSEEDQLEKDLQIYYDELDRCNNSTLIEIGKEKYLKSFENYYCNSINDLNLFYSILLNDYYTLYINYNLNKSNDNNLKQNLNQNEKADEINKIEKFDFEGTKKFLKYLVSLKNKYSKNENCDKIQFIANSINWLESYEEEITILLKMFSKLSTIIPNLYNEVEEIIRSKQIKFEISERNPKYNIILNKAFLLCMEAILRVASTKIAKIFEESEDKFTELQNISKEIYQDAMQLNSNLGLYSKEVYSLEEIIILIDAFNMNNAAKLDNIKKLIKFFSLENNYIKKGKTNELIRNLEDLYGFLNSLIGGSKDYYKIIIKILKNEFLKVYDENYRIKILYIIFLNNEIIINSTQLIKIIMKNYIINDPSDNILSNIKILSDEKMQLIHLLNSKENEKLNIVILNIFEREIFHYFESIPLINDPKIKQKYPKFFKSQKKTSGIILDQSFTIFQKLVENLESIIVKESKNKKVSNLSKLYSISYIKIYLKYFVTFIKEKKINSKDMKEIIDFICVDPKNNFRKVLKIYILKLFNSLMESFEEFKTFNFQEYGIDFKKDFSLWEEEQTKNNGILNQCLINLDNNEDKNNFNEVLKNFEISKENKFLKDEKILLNNINDFGIDPFLCISINKIFSNLGNLDIKQNEELKNFYQLAKKLFDKYQCNQNLKDLLLLFFDEKNFNQKIKKSIKINSKTFEIILYSYRFCVQSLEAIDIQIKNRTNKKLLYSSLLENKCITNLTSSYFPGSEPKEEMHLTTLNVIEDHLNVNPDTIGCYVCSCGYYYSIQSCGFPNETSTCPICKLKIGSGPRIKYVGYHGLVQREGHYRIFKDENQHQVCMKRYGDADVNVPNMTLENYKKKVIEPLLNIPIKGLTIVSKDWFLQRNKKIRKLNDLSYRILNFINYSHLFFANCLGYISNADLEKYCLVKGMKCTEIIEKEWELIGEILQQKNIQSIQIFMNLIFKRVSNLIKNCEYFIDIYQRNNFEDKIVNVIDECLGEYKDYSTKFINENQLLLQLDNKGLKSTICELSPPTEDIYPPEEYPLFNYFVLTKYCSVEDLKKKLGPENVYAMKYPLLFQYLKDNPDIIKMKYLPAYNIFTNYMVDYYSFRISRDDAKNRTLKNEPIFSEKIFTNKFNSFTKAWNEIKGEAIKYKCRPIMKKKDLSSNDKLVYFLNDDGELGYGMYLAAAGQNFITWQNSFLQPIIDSVAQNGILHCFAKNMQRRIPLQNAKLNQILLIEDCFNNSPYYNFEDILSTFSKRDMFTDKTINYSNYNSFIYDFVSIEEELGKLLLPGKCLFENEDNLNFITYWSEGFRGGKSDTLSLFYLKYPQKDLTEDEKLVIINYLEKQKQKKDNDLKSFFGSMQLIIFYLATSLCKNDEKIINIIDNSSQYLKVSNVCYNFFEKEGKEFTLEKLMNIFSFIEYMCFKELSDTLQQEYKKEIPKDLQEKIKQKLLGPNAKYEVYSISQLASAVRRYISRYLAGKRQTVDIDDKRDLAFDLSRIDLWDEKIGKLDNLEDIIVSQLSEFKLTVGQAYEFYKLIAHEDLCPKGKSSSYCSSQ